ncbi:uncharacterized protein LOC111279381 [Durio zibethinus]|uniref:Uncharacterized protein LOC111279381 n=1 Tax=Durio zibethinus TaxID=66656 RepID=A0A6P5X333_DURZI|nr:uncharacterized protein LOC111279381 [Durio zibethinus]
MFSTSPDLPQNKTLQIKQEDKFFSRLLSKENSVANPSFRVYYGGVSGTVPFMWESQPGTPKYTFSDTSLPPLTPPPSYYSMPNSKPIKKHSRSSLLHALFPTMNSLKKTNLVPSSPSSSSSSSWSSSPMFLAISPAKYQRRSRFSTPGSSFDSRVDDEEAAAIGSPTSTLCFTVNGRGSVIGKLRGCYGW